jgi:hypothetical protein
MSDFFIGFNRAAADGTDARLRLKPDSLLRHMMALGSSGSGKTVLCKVVVEEMIRSGIPAICIDPQGDLCSLAMHADDPEMLAKKGVDPALAEKFRRCVDPVVFTPASRKGIALSADPMAIDIEGLDTRDRVYAITNIAAMVVSLLGYDLDSDDGLGLVAVLDNALTGLAERGRFPANLEQFTSYLLKLDDAGKEQFGRLLDVKKIDHACQKLARLDVGARRLLFHEGLATDVELLLGLGNNSARLPGKTRLSVIYLNTLHSQEDKEFFVAALVERLYTWMLKNPSTKPQALFYIDEVAPFIPPVRKPASKPGLSLLFKQARKYGVCCLMATQNPGDVDYKAMSQFGTWAIGRLTTRQDMKKVEPTVKSLDPVNVDKIMEELPSQKPGEFVLISPDNFDQTHRLQSRWLYTQHQTLDDERIEALMDLPLAAAIPVDPKAPPESEEEPISVRERFYELEDELVVKTLDAKADPNDEEEEGEPLPASDTRRRGSDAEEEAEEEALEEESEEEAPPVSARGRASPEVTESLPTQSTTGSRMQAPLVDEELEAADRLLAKLATASAKDFAAKAGIGLAAARGRLMRMLGAKRARRYKEGRENRYYSVASGLRPELGLLAPVKVIVGRVSSNDAERAARELRRSSSLFGLVGDDETLDRAEIDHRLVIQLSFTEKVTRMFIKRLFGPTHDELLDSVYLHPENMKIVIFHPQDGIRLEERPEEYASRIMDFDGKVTFEQKPPAEVKLHESELQRRKPDEQIKESFKLRFKATPKKIDLVFLPVWNLHLKSSRTTNSRIVTVDALVGKPLDW